MANLEYSEKARRKKICGSVLIGLTVDESGTPVNVHVERGLGYGLDEKALAAVKQYRFQPATQDGRAVPVQIKVEVKFQIF